MTKNPIFKLLLSVAPLLLAAGLLAGCDETVKSPPGEERAPSSEDASSSGDIASGPDDTASSEQVYDVRRSDSEVINTPLGNQAGEDVFICGGETTRASVDFYFAKLQSALLDTDSNRKFSEFVGARFGIKDAQGTMLRFVREDLTSGKAGTISRNEWQKISHRGADGLKDAGWRGCFMDEGKVWFQADMENGLKLSSISRSLPWVETAEK